MIKHIKSVIVRILFCAHIVVFAYVCLYGLHGLQSQKAVNVLKQNNDQLIKEISQLNQKIASLEEKVAGFDQHWTYNMENKAGSQMPIASKGDAVYYIS